MKKTIPRPPDTEEVICAHCGKKFMESGYAALTRFLLGNHNPACSYECNKALGQVN